MWTLADIMFAKIYNQIFDSSIAEDHQVRHCFMDLLVLADLEGVVDMTIEAIARRTNVPIEQVARCIAELSKPDARSRSNEECGARIKLIDSHRDWGWQIINYDHYRELRDEDGRRAYFRDYKRKQRAKNKVAAKQMSTVSTSVNIGQPQSTHAEAEAEAEVDHYHKDSRAALHILNETSGRSFRETDPNLTFISSRLREPGVDLAGVRKMIERQCKRWKGTDQAEYLRPETLFNKTKFDGYYAARNEPLHEYEAHQRPNPRLEGVSRNPINDYAAGARRKQEQQNAERLEQQMVETANRTPSKAP